MNAKQIMETQDFKKCADFHGHVCPGLSIGYRAAKAGMEWLRENRSEDEEIVSIVETDACCTDAVQVITGCTFGKGNFVYKDHGKMVFTFLSRNTGKGVRFALKHGAMQLNEEHRNLLHKVMGNAADESERKRFQDLHLHRSIEILEKPLEELFSVSETHFDLPKKARIEPSKLCSCCGEPVMESKLQITDGKAVCRACK